MWGLVLGEFIFIERRLVSSSRVVHVVGVLVLDIGNELKLLGDSKAYKCQHSLFNHSN